MAFDVADAAAAAAAIGQIAAEHGRLDILVNNVGRRDRRSLFEFSLEDVRALLEVDLVAPFHLSREAAKPMIAAGRGRIINITSIAGPISDAGDTPYTTAKGALEALTRALAAELGGYGITVNAIAPGFFATETNAAKVADESVQRWLAQRTSLGRWGQPHEIAGAAVFLASPAASYVTGHVLAVDGGYLAHF
jgi:gluconate 5-dehydrogenase